MKQTQLICDNSQNVRIANRTETTPEIHRETDSKRTPRALAE